LGIGIVHDDDMAHAGGGRSTGDRPAIQNENLQTCARALGGASSSDNSSADYDEVEGFRHGNRQKCLNVKASKREKPLEIRERR
jgi:hypothetical protein